MTTAACYIKIFKQDVDQVDEVLKNLQADIIRGPWIIPYSKDYYTIYFYAPDGQEIEVAYAPDADLNKKNIIEI